MTVDLETPTATAEPPDTAPRRSRLVLVAVLAVALLAIAGTVGWLVGNNGSSSSTPTESSVDAGFARDMSTHHTQAINMANYTRDATSDPNIQILARDIETEQYFQVGEMQGWLDAWGLSRSSTLPVMSWMGGTGHLQADGQMSGMASPAQMDKLETLKGKALDIFFLQLMIHHHQGGLPMAQYAALHAQNDYVRNLAQKMAQAQSNEIVQMEQMLRQLGGSPLPPPE
ncbi:MAG TPA: DUF305 domain-containing protein [Jatrophihabitantaceae bacterium]|jgi:uncharacterized protein (DUF305 family)